MATPNQNWFNSNTPTVDDANGTSYYQSNPTPAGTSIAGIHDYSTDIYEGWSDSDNDAEQTDIDTYSTGKDDNFVYFQFNQVGDVDGNESVVFHVEIDTDGDGVGDYWLAYNPSNNDPGTTWRNSNNISVEIAFDENDDVGGDVGDSDFDYDGDGFEEIPDLAGNGEDVFARIVDGNVEIAVSLDYLGNPTSPIGSRGWTRQQSNIDKSKIHWHDHQKIDDLNSQRIDNTAGAGDLLVECFLTGTHILTENGEVAVEELKIGDKVQTAEGTLEPIKWIGRQTATAEQLKNPLRGLPILIREGALGNNLPMRDLYVSPDHAMLVDGLLINAGALVNDVSIVKTQPAEAFTYYHIELDKHALIIAEGAAAESYLPQKEDRYLYDNGAEYEELYPNQCNMILWPLDYPRVSSYTTVPRYVRKNLMAIAKTLNHAQALQTV